MISLATLALVADQRILLAAVSVSRTSNADIFTYLGIAAGGIGMIAGIIYWLNRVTHKRRFDSHPGLFQGLCQAHGLGRNDRNLLKQLARQYQLTQPGLLFVNPDLYDPGRIGQPLKAKQKELLALRDSLFGGGDKQAKTPAKQAPSPKKTKPAS
ncbi:MAG: hypothetical protein JW818_21835 [Pirellulales bacterium]|nr:hypothetical protein [Pirellulales bacterium]